MTSLRRLLLAVALLTVGLPTLAGCGGDGDEAAVANTVETYLSALAKGDGQEACDQLTGSQARKVLEGFVVQLPELQATSCADALSKLSGSLGGEEKGGLEDAEATNVEIRGDSATAEVVGGTQTVSLTRTDGHWLISGGLNLTP